MRYQHETSQDPTGSARSAGLRRLSRLTWRATQLSAVTAVGFATLFARTAPVQTADQTTTAPSTGPSVSVSSAGTPTPPGDAAGWRTGSEERARRAAHRAGRPGRGPVG